MSDIKLGTLLEGTEQRDAIHVAIAPVTAWQTLYPGQHIGFVDGGKVLVAPGIPVLIGIIDPFLETRVMKGERCWLFLYQNTVTSLRHEWTHPAFEKRPEPPLTRYRGDIEDDERCAC